MIQNQRQLEGRNELSLEEEYICSYFVEEFLVAEAASVHTITFEMTFL